MLLTLIGGGGTLCIALLALGTTLLGGDKFNLWNDFLTSAPGDSWPGTHVSRYYLKYTNGISVCKRYNHTLYKCLCPRDIGRAHPLDNSST